MTVAHNQLIAMSSGDMELVQAAAPQTHHQTKEEGDEEGERKIDDEVNEEEEDEVANGHECQPLKVEDNIPEAGKDTDTNEKKPSFLVRVKTEPTFRYKLLQTSLLCLSFLGYGWDLAILGPTLPELQLLTGEDLSTQSWIFTLGSVGYLIGSVIGGYMYDKMCKTLLLTLSSGLMSLALLVMPFCRIFAVMVAVRAFVGVSEALVDTGCNAHVVHIWGLEAGPYMQVMHFAFSVGALVAPLATAPFLAEKIVTCSSTWNTSEISITSLASESLDASSEYSRHQTIDFLTTSAFHVDLVRNSTNQSTDAPEHCTEIYEDLRVHYAYVIAAVVSFIPAAGFAILTCTNASNITSVRTKDDSSSINKIDTKQAKLRYPKKIVIILLALVLIHSSLHCILDDSFGRFFMTFFLEYLQWTKAKSATAVFIFWLLYGLGNFVAIFLVSCCDRSIFLRTFVGLFAASYVVFFFSSQFVFEPLIWVSVGMVGFSMSVIFPGLMTWTSDNVTPMTGKISGLFMVSASLAGFPFPPIIGSVIEHLGPMWFVYILGVVLVICIVTFLGAQIFLSVANDKWRLANDGEEEIEIEVRTTENSV